MLAFQHGEHQVFMTIGAFGINVCVPELPAVQVGDEFPHFFAGDDPHDHLSIGDPFFDQHSHKNAHGKTSGIGDVADPVVEVFKDLPDGHQPYKRFKKTKHRSRETTAAQHVDDANGIDRHVADT